VFPESVESNTTILLPVMVLNKEKTAKSVNYEIL